jgi:hypothetical protein
MNIAVITEKIRRAFGARPRASGVPRSELLRLQVHLAETCGGRVIGCPCGGVVTPVVNHQPFGMEIAALVCIACHTVNALDECGLFAAPEAVPASCATVH